MKLAFPIRCLTDQIEELQALIKKREVEIDEDDFEVVSALDSAYDDIDNADEQIEQHQNALKILMRHGS